MSRLTFDRYRRDTGDSEGEWTSAATPLTLGTAAAAFVHDTTSAGPISVVRGERYRLEAAPAVGSIRFVNVLADYRRYVMPAPFYTVAARVLHAARYGVGADDPRIPPLYLGSPSLVRGYRIDSLVESQCVAALATGCGEIAHMLGSRLAVANLEARFPLLRPLGISPAMYGPVPVEVAFFADGGLVWRGLETVPTDGAAWSAGVTLRTSLLGFGLGQFDVVRPFRNRPAGWVFQFTLAPPL
jgi:outer membrane protein assembly factor BamA